MSLRISVSESEESGRRGPGEPVSSDYYLDRLVKLIPGEAVVAYPFLQSRAQDVILQMDLEEKVAQAKSAGSYTVESAQAMADSVADAATIASPDHWLLIGIAWLILIVVVLLRWQATRGPDGRPQWGAVFIAAVSFFLWVPVMHGTFGVIGLFESAMGDPWPRALQRFIPELLLVLWTTLVPAFYKPQG